MAGGASIFDGLDRGPALLRAHPTALHPPPGFWSAPAVIAWIGSRDSRLVAAVEVEQAAWSDFPEQTARGLWDDLKSDLAHYCALPFGDHSCDRFSYAVRQLMERLSDERLVGYGVRDGEAEHSPIAGHTFAGAELTFSRTDGFRLLPGVGRLRFVRSDVLGNWPAFGGASVAQLAPTPSAVPRVRGHAVADAPLVARMRVMVASGEASSPYRAAQMLEPEAKGHGSTESRVRRLERRYYDTHPKATTI